MSLIATEVMMIDKDVALLVKYLRESDGRDGDDIALVRSALSNLVARKVQLLDLDSSCTDNI